MQTKAGSLKTLSLASLIAVFAAATSSYAANPLEATIEDFESGGTAGAVAVDSTNSSSGGASNSAVANVMESSSKRLKISDADGGVNGVAITFPGAIPAPGYYLFAADLKVDNASAAVGSYGMGAKVGAASATQISDVNAGYVMNLVGTGDASLGYQTVGAAVNVVSGGTIMQVLFFMHVFKGSQTNQVPYFQGSD